MSRKPLLAIVAVLWSMSLAGCHIYFGDDTDDDYTYCDDTGCYTCDDFGCYPQGGGAEPGWQCDDNYDCAAGCFCNADGVCEEAGFCTAETQATDCPEGFVCDERGSCVPDGSDPTCTSDEGCPIGAYCDEASGACVPTSTCEMGCADGLACDVDRDTCVPADEVALCQAEVLCDEAAPACPEGSNPGIVNGCWNGECIADEACPDGAPVTCEDHATEAECIADESCDAVYRGINCTSPTGASCTSGDANCTCESFAFNSCEDAI